jgi:hypothetical protein
MATMREHLAGLHKNFAEHFREKSSHHQAVAKSHEEHASLHDELHKSTGVKTHKDFATRHRADAAVHKSMAGHYSEQADHHAGKAEDCAKAADDQMNKLAPTAVSGVTRDNPNIRAVPRPGQREPAKANVPVEFQKLFTVEDEEEARVG